MIRKLATLSALTVAINGLASTVAYADTDYHIDLTSPEHHSARVTTTFAEQSGDYVDVKMPAWRTGFYHILDLANGVRDFSATAENGAELRWKKIDKSTWRVFLDNAGDVTINYELYANQLGRRSRHIDDSHAYLDASAVFMYSEQSRQQPLQVSLDVPAGWRSVSGMAANGEHSFVAPNWDVLVDSPIETGVNELRKFAQNGRQYEVVFWGQGNYDVDKTVADIQKLVAEAGSIWSSYPFQRYVFMIHATSGAGGATEHKNSTIIQRPRDTFAERDDYLSFMSTTSHEFVHTWNVKAYRPDGLVPYDYQQENYTELLWIAEGSTSYFQDHLLLRAGIMEPQEYFANLAKDIERHRNKPGRKVMSVAQSSFEAWIDQSGDRAHNSSVNIYSEGELVSWLLDIELLKRSDGKVSYRDVHDALYQQFDADEQGFKPADVLAVLQQLTGQSWQDWWQQYVTSPADIDLDKLLADVGLKLIYGDDDGAQQVNLGWQTKAHDNGVQLTRVSRGEPAWQAGFTPDDIIVAIDGSRVTEKRLATLLAMKQPGDEIQVSFFRRDQLQQKTVTLGAKPKGKAKVIVNPDASAAERQRFEQWLGIDYPAADKDA
ncbi:M61 family metallopeptidase [Idiomarina xiamenensis]|uniref:Aminopeptidase n=1 Tax=Idiomarina xiamenensis 10-D-4 TaxID=740709 RepID=K2KQX8_9GAMM|nr:PDZ domain-containing protein [Idiomarina xiamenensis]EKE84864.1 aminopeptidase [Idiomarina xiamenensis 10-D-4]